MDASRVPDTAQRHPFLLVDIGNLSAVRPRACTLAFPCGNALTPARRNPLNRFNRRTRRDRPSWIIDGLWQPQAYTPDLSH